MIKVENIEVSNIARAVYSARNAMNSWDRSDSDLKNDILGPNDLGLAQRLFKAGNAHAKYLRTINVTMDITCNHFWWAEMDTYVFAIRQSCSKMHKIHVKPFDSTDFSHEGIDEVGGDVWVTFADVLCTLEMLRQKFNETQEKKYWRAMLELLPMGYNIKATITTNYQTIMDILQWRTNHKVQEWVEFCEIMRKELPYIKAIRGEE